MAFPRSLLAGALLSLLACMSTTHMGAQALTFVPVRDSALASDTHSECVFVGQVTRVSERHHQGKTRAVTRTYVKVTDVLKRGFHDKNNKDSNINERRDHLQKGEQVVVVSPGGYDPDADVRTVVPGAPKFAEGEKVLLFVRHRSDPLNRSLPLEDHEGNVEHEQPNMRVFSISHVALGAFREFVPLNQTSTKRGQDTAFAVSELVDAHEPALRDFDGFVRYLKAHDDASRAQAQGKRGAVLPQEGAGYLHHSVRMSDVRPRVAMRQSRWAYLSSSKPRWFNFESSFTDWQTSPGGQPDYSPKRVWPNDAYPQVDEAIDMFNQHQGTRTAYRRQGTHSSTKGLETSDGRNMIIYNDPNNEIGDPFSCSSGGTLAIGGYRSSGSGTFNGQSHRKIIEGDVVMNKNLGCDDFSLDELAELYAHEFGHTLGFGHTDVRGALMWRSNSGRGANMDPDDEGILIDAYKSSKGNVPCQGNLYASCKGSSPPPAGPPPPPPTGTPPPPPPPVGGTCGIPATSGTCNQVIPIAASTDDAEEWASGGDIDCGSSDLELVWDGGAQTIGVRFRGVNLDSSMMSRVKRVSISFTNDDSESQEYTERTDLRFYGDDTDNSGAFCGGGKTIVERSKTSANVAWSNLPTFTGANHYFSPNLKSIAQEIVGRGGWSKGNSMSFIITGSGKRVVNSYGEYCPPHLYIEMDCQSAPPPGSPPPASPPPASPPPQSGCDSTSNCYGEHSRTGCECDCVQKCVCKKDPFCCNNRWDRMCASHLSDPDFGCRRKMSDCGFAAPAMVNNSFCLPRTCADYPGKCGAQPDGCGGITPPCSCAGSLSCDVDFTCKSCVRRTCASLGATCGEHSDGCGGKLNCGGCDSVVDGNAQICSGSTCVAKTCKPTETCQPGECGDRQVPCTPPGGGANLTFTLSCGACECIPTKTCGTQTCGTINDGCGNVVSCGTCPVNAPCSSATLTCRGIQCGKNQMLQAGACVCAPGFVEDSKSFECVDPSSLSAMSSGADAAHSGRGVVAAAIALVCAWVGATLI